MTLFYILAIPVVAVLAFAAGRWAAEVDSRRPRWDDQ
jgi:hypothetical protein